MIAATRRGIVRVALAALIGVCLGGAAGPARAEHEPEPGAYVRWLEDPDRAEWQKPEAVVAALGLEGGETVVDLGAGSGYFTRRLARAVGSRGRVVAADVSAAMLRHLDEHAKSEGLANVELRQVARDDPRLGARAADLVFLCDTYHHLADRVAYLRRLAPSLRPSGRLAIVDFHKRPDVPHGPPLEEKLSREVVLDELGRSGFELDREETFLPYQYLLVFRRKARLGEQDLIRELDTAFTLTGPVEAKRAAVAEALGRFLTDGVLDPKHTRLESGPPITTYLLHADPGGAYSVGILVFPPRAATPLHDHQAWVVWGTYSGREREDRFERLGPADPEHFPELRPVFTKVYPDDGLAFIPDPPGDLHVVENLGDEVSISIHVHSTDIAERVRNNYDVVKKLVVPFVQSYEPATGDESAGREGT